MGRAPAMAAVLVIAVHLVLALLFPQHAWITCVCWIALYGLALVVIAQRMRISEPSVRGRWHLLGINFSILLVQFALILLAEYTPAGLNSKFEHSNELLRAFRSLPLLLIVCTPEQAGRKVNRCLDALQTLLIALCFLALFIPGLLHPGENLGLMAAELFNRYIYAQTIFLTILALLAIPTASSVEAQLLHTMLAAYLCIGTPIGIWTNEVLINGWQVAPSSALFVLSDASMATFIFTAWLLRPRPAPLQSRPALLFLRLASPVFLPMFAILAAMLLAVAGHFPALGIALGVASLVVYGIRSTYGQYQLIVARQSLEAANSQLKVLSQHDALTGLYNRRWFSEALQKEWRVAQRGGFSISLLQIDVDFFKLYNDRLGHGAGDVCLQTVATCLERNLRRANDSVVRHGGEEFVALLPTASGEEAVRIAEKLRAAVTALQIPHPESPWGMLTISVGVATCNGPGPDQTPDALLHMADAALYEAKRQGKNCVRTAMLLHATDSLGNG